VQRAVNLVDIAQIAAQPGKHAHVLRHAHHKAPVERWAPDDANGRRGVGEAEGPPARYSTHALEIGRASCRERVEMEVGGEAEDGIRDATVTGVQTCALPISYSAPLHMEMIPVIGEREGQPEMVYIGDLPVMLKSRICLLSKLSPDDLVGVGEDPLDPGGYFIVNGSERVIVALEDLAANRILVDVEHTGVNPTYKAKIFSTTVGFRARIEVALKSDGGTYVT